MVQVRIRCSLKTDSIIVFLVLSTKICACLVYIVECIVYEQCRENAKLLKGFTVYISCGEAVWFCGWVGVRLTIHRYINTKIWIDL